MHARLQYRSDRYSELAIFSDSNVERRTHLCIVGNYAPPYKQE